jgi:hypothetical protein
MVKKSRITEEREIVFAVPKKLRFDKDTVVVLDERMPWAGMPLKKDGITVGYIQKATFMGNMIRLTAIIDASLTDDEVDLLRFGL